MPAQPLSPTQLAEAARLKHLFQNWQAARKAAGLPSSQEAAAGLLGFGQSALAQYLNGKIPLNVEAGLKFASLLEVSFSEFSPTIASHATRLAETVTSNSSRALAQTPGSMSITGDDDHAPESVAIRMVALHIQAGIDGIETAPLPDDDGRHHVPRQWLEENDLSPRALLAIKIKGESMQPLMYEGDIAVINIADRARKSGGVFALNYNGQAVIKRLKYERREWYLTSENPEFRAEPCRGAECIVIGRVVRFEPRNFRDRL